MSKFIIGFLLAFLFASSAISEPGSRQRLDDFLAGLHTLQADFQQIIQESETGENQFASGTFYLSRPGRFRWDYESPSKQYILADGHTIWLVEEDLEQVSQRFQKSALKGTPAQLLAGSGKVNDNFISQELDNHLGMSWLELTPTDEDSQFDRIRLGFQEEMLANLEMTDKFGQVTQFRFSNIQRNPLLEQTLFQFVPPPGYDILDQ